jgi:hypothetical protein
MTVTEPQTTPPEPPDPNDPNNITVEVPGQPPAQPPPPTSGNRQARSGADVQTFTAEDVERIRQEERARYGTVTSQLDELNAEISRYRQADEERAKADDKIRKDAEKAEKKKQEEEMELRDLITKKDQEWEEKLAAERAERERTLAVLEQERRHATLQNYLSQQMMEKGELIAPQLRKLVAGNSEQEIDAKISELVDISESLLGDTQQLLQRQNAQRPTVGVTAPPVGPVDMTGGTRTYTPDDIKALTPEEYAAQRESLLRAASNSRRQ